MNSSTTQRPANLRNPFVAPTSEVEQKMAELWQELLRVERVGIHDNFFRLGGQSLQGIQLVSRLRQIFAVDLPLVALFEAPTVAGLAGMIEDLLISQIEELGDEESELLSKSEPLFGYSPSATND